MPIYEMRGWLKKAYGGSIGWCKKVDKMHNKQVEAVYISFKRRGLI